MRRRDPLLFLKYSLMAVVLAMGIHALDTRADTPDAVNCRAFFDSGQEWSLKSGSGAKVIVGKVEDWRDGVAVHVSIVDIAIPSGRPRAGTMTQIDHVPFSCGALMGSVAKLLRKNVSPSSGFEDGYKQWRDANGGVFTIGVNDVIELMLKSLPGN